jgi:hypothetical protein
MWFDAGWVGGLSKRGSWLVAVVLWTDQAVYEGGTVVSDALVSAMQSQVCNRV